ncbi:CDGSH iron-sulfur domain-containing protein [Amycolatopsis tucumanensis]|uniref:Iron-binding zinc finger CDGSH type domain-containing protein n=1 Tax=Amycolatopsis tucumanensis TaxID=401106 RepID=A0ABP7JPG8_9PSEU|nr:CDGSH iron-sulfur domain-containing protein [Amycolatopsis tucumanensis]MCF6425010.1 CDGSH iron-sulfur domain-containing protein [Amycolatopsis tucumanensis]
MTEQAPTPPVVIKTVDNGPYQIKGPVRIVDHENNEYELGPGRTQVLCRCGHSARKPFCDGSHTRQGFSAAERAQALDNRP